MLIGIDFDGTISADVPTFRQVIQQFLNGGHQIAVVSARNESQASRDEIRSAILQDQIPIILTSHNPKQAWCEFHGIHIDIWIENNPRSIYEIDDVRKWKPATTPQDRCGR